MNDKTLRVLDSGVNIPHIAEMCAQKRVKVAGKGSAGESTGCQTLQPVGFSVVEGERQLP